ncbi:MAG: hypothetical protein QOJ38_973 [Solirubrobacterales bacterium]|jgi:hypothetical protein|nr:hypothetical protein [Solirubrobacterales bacterium]
MEGKSKEASESSESGGNARRICLVPPELAGKVADQLTKHFADDPNVEVIVERRSAERRSGKERRQKDTGAPKGGEERRKIHNADGRRVGERRATLVPVDPPEDLPRKVRRYLDGNVPA